MKRNYIKTWNILYNWQRKWWLKVIRFDFKKGRIEEEGPLSQARALIYLEGNPSDGDSEFGVGFIHTSDFRVRVGVTQLTVGF